MARWLSARIDPAHALFVSNSLPVRMLQAFARRDGPRGAWVSNCGASGIDGIVSIRRPACGRSRSIDDGLCSATLSSCFFGIDLNALPPASRAVAARR
ncbi:MAG: hypothetical protein H6826_08735 [Planctomycetes bacterium]|nr:hypothetical protein [Planctomycetota bacterium]